MVYGKLEPQTPRQTTRDPRRPPRPFKRIPSPRSLWRASNTANSVSVSVSEERQEVGAITTEDAASFGSAGGGGGGGGSGGGDGGGGGGGQATGGGGMYIFNDDNSGEESMGASPRQGGGEGVEGMSSGGGGGGGGGGSRGGWVGGGGEDGAGEPSASGSSAHGDASGGSGAAAAAVMQQQQQQRLQQMARWALCGSGRLCRRLSAEPVGGGGVVVFFRESLCGSFRKPRMFVSATGGSPFWVGVLAFAPETISQVRAAYSQPLLLSLPPPGSPYLDAPNDRVRRAQHSWEGSRHERRSISHPHRCPASRSRRRRRKFFGRNCQQRGGGGSAAAIAATAAAAPAPVCTRGRRDGGRCFEPEQHSRWRG